MPPHAGGIERVAASLCDGLSGRGHDVRWISSGDSRIVDRPSRFRVPAWNILETRVGVPYPIWAPAGLRKIAELVAWADVVHAHDCLYFGSASAALACRVHKKPLLITQHVGLVPFGPALDWVESFAYFTLGRAVLQAATRRVACSAHVPAWFSSIGVHADFELVPNAIDERFRPLTARERQAARHRWSIPETARLILFVGRLVPKKCLALVVEAHRRLAEDGTMLLVVGDGPQAGILGGVPRLNHQRSVAPDDMPEIYGMADVFLLPSRGEGLPLSVQEALATGVPSVVSDDPAFTSNLNAFPGIRFARTVDDIIAAIRANLAAPASAPELVATFARRRWGMERFLADYERIICELVENQRRCNQS